ncbi:hypothetical protein VQ042_02390 [Aurantimonas sp. A2-1-M11]|uniref:hypothetical protein n=1 Tax=Aurantimonas sp. A2-1-M11 TaxID=3113712 RepID=UPI002F94F5A6
MTTEHRTASIANQLDFPGHGRQASLHPLQQAAMRLGEARDGRSRLKAKDLVGLLLSHGARAWRASQPVAHTRIRTMAPEGRPAIHLRFG